MNFSVTPSPSAEPPRDLGTDPLVEMITRRLGMQRADQMAQQARLGDELARKLERQRLDNAVFQADRAISNARTQRLMGSLAAKFSLISKIQQNLG